MIEEQIDFNNAVEAVVEWIRANSSWEETLLIITADHEAGQLWGPKAGPRSKTPFNLPQNNGASTLPGARYFSGEHTNALVPLYVIGPGAELFQSLVDGKDTMAAAAWGFSGRYVDNTDVFKVMKEANTAPVKTNTAMVLQ
jgi:alkaline phosphatase